VLGYCGPRLDCVAMLMANKVVMTARLVLVHCPVVFVARIVLNASDRDQRAIVGDGLKTFDQTYE
jgi:hypothetical protein